MKVLTIGKNPICDIVISSGDDCDTVSKFHADLVLSKNGEQYLLTDRASTNGTFISEGGEWRKIKQVQVSPKSLVRLGNFKSDIESLLASAKLRYDAKSKALETSDGRKSMKLELIAAKGPYRNPETGEIVL